MHICRVLLQTPSGYSTVDSLSEAFDAERENEGVTVLGEITIELSDDEVLKAVSCFIDDIAR